MHRALAAEIAAAASHHPLLIVLDDLHRADTESLTLFARIAQESNDIPVLLVGTYRPQEDTPALAETIARIAPGAPVRLELTGLDVDAIAQIVATSVEVGETTLHAIAERTSGNPFFVQETARLLASEGTRALSKVPTGVRDVVMRRAALLPLDTQVLLHRATILGREIDVDVLTAMAEGTSEDAVIDGLEAAVLLGLLEETASGDLRFTHVLIRETLYTTIFGIRRSRWHAQAAQAIEAVRPNNVTALAHHYLAAAPNGRTPQPGMPALPRNWPRPVSRTPMPSAGGGRPSVPPIRHPDATLGVGSNSSSGSRAHSPCPARPWKPVTIAYRRWNRLWHCMTRSSRRE